MKSKTELLKQKKVGIIAIIIGLVITAFGLNTYTNAEKQLMKLDSIKLDNGALK